MEGERKGPYRSRKGMVLGVVRGFAEYWEFNVFWLRFFVVMLILFTGIWPGMFFYFLAALILKMEPETAAGAAPADAVKDKMDRLKGKFDRLDKRIRRMEDVVTSKEFSWKKRFDEE
jgi:phage shock protein C